MQARDAAHEGGRERDPRQERDLLGPLDRVDHHGELLAAAAEADHLVALLAQLFPAARGPRPLGLAEQLLEVIRIGQALASAGPPGREASKVWICSCSSWASSASSLE